MRTPIGRESKELFAGLWRAHQRLVFQQIAFALLAFIRPAAGHVIFIWIKAAREAGRTGRLRWQEQVRLIADRIDKGEALRRTDSHILWTPEMTCFTLDFHFAFRTLSRISSAVSLTQSVEPPTRTAAPAWGSQPVFADL